jgi:hypothetical protein
VLYWDAMTRKQKQILIILGVLDFVVIGALAAIVVRTTIATSVAPTVIVQTKVARCLQTMMETCNALPAPFNDTASVAWDMTQLNITLHAVYPTATPPPESAQLLWTALDETAAVLKSGCYVPDTITIALTARGNAETVQYLAQLAGQDVSAWMAGTLSDENLAAQSHFRQSIQFRQD